MKVYEAIARAVSDTVRGPVFGLMGDGNLDLLAEFADRCGRTVVHTRHEQHAVAMADGYSRFSGEVGLCSVTQGPGLTNTATSLAVARHHHSPALLLAGQSSLGDVHNAQRLDQLAFATVTAGAAAVVDDVRALVPVLTTAFRHLEAGRGPFVLNLPNNVQRLDLPDGWRFAAGLSPAAGLADPDAVKRAADMLARAQQPAILAGRGAVRANADAVIARLSSHLGAPITGSLLAKGLCSGHPLTFGVSGGLGEGAADEVLKSCDVLLAIGASLNQWTTTFRELIGNAKVIQIDEDPAAFDYYTPVALALLGDARLATEQIYETLQQQTETKINKAANPVVRQARSRDYTHGDDGSLDPRCVLDLLNDFLPPDRILVADGGHCVQATCQRMSVANPRNWAYSFDFGCIGQGIGLAIGGCFARPGHRVTLITGDGAFMMGLADVDTAARYRLPLSIIILNDGAFGQERHTLERKGLSARHAMQPAPDFVQLASGLGGRGYRIEGSQGLDDLRAYLGEVDAQTGLLVLDVAINGAVELPVSGEIARHMH